MYMWAVSNPLMVNIYSFMYNVCPMFCTFHNNISKCYVLLPGITMVTLSVRPVPSVQVSTTPLSCSRSATVPVNVRVELRHVALLLSFSVNVTPLAGIGTRHVVPDANTLMVPLNTELDQMRRLLLLLQVYLSVGGCRNSPMADFGILLYLWD